MNQTVLITGASRGIGAAAARLFAHEGWNVAINWQNSEDSALALARELGERAVAVQADVADERQVRSMVARVNARFGDIGVLVNNAGIAQQKLFTEITGADWDRMFDVNVKGAYHCAQAVARQMIGCQDGAIINVSSIWGVAGASCEVHYSAAKAAVIGFTKALAKELGLSGIRVNCVAPGVIDTEMNAAIAPEILEQLCEDTPLRSMGTAEDVAQLIYFLASERSRFITGQVISPNGGYLI